MNKLPTTKRELFEFFEAIPEAEWGAKFGLTDGRTLCANGHIAVKLCGMDLDALDAAYRVHNEEVIDAAYAKVNIVLRPLGLSTVDLWSANDGLGSSKVNVLNFLQQEAPAC